MPDTPTPGQVNYAAYFAARAVQMVETGTSSVAPWHTLGAAQAPWEAAAQAVLGTQKAQLLYVVVLHAEGQIQLCGAYASEDDAQSHLAHARTIMPDRHGEVRVCPFRMTGQEHRQEPPCARS